jgi:hypothetical protein
MDKFLSGFAVGWLGLFFILYALGLVNMRGDMNKDNVLNITDLSILASVINEQG